MLDVSDEVRAEIGNDEAARLLAGENAPGAYDCTSCRTPGDTGRERTSTVLFVGEETAVLAFAHATCIPSQVVTVTEEQVQGAVRHITGDESAPAAVAEAARSPQIPEQPDPGRRQAVLGITCGQVLIDETLHAALVVEPTGPVVRPGSEGPGDDFLPLLIEQGLMPLTDVSTAPGELAGWSVLLATGQLHAILQPAAPGAQPTAWWQAHQPLPVTDEWRTTATRSGAVLVYAAPAGAIGQQPREDMLRDALDTAAQRGVLVAARMPLAGL